MTVLVEQRKRIDHLFHHEHRVAEHDRLPVDLPAHALPGARLEIRRFRERQAAAASLGDDRVGERMFASLVEARGDAQHLRVVESCGSDHRAKRRLPDRERAGLVHDERIDRAQRFDRFRVAEEHAARGAAAHGDHDRHRRGEPQRARARDDEHGHGAYERVEPARLGSEESPREERGDRDRDHAQHEPIGDDVGHALHRRTGALRLRHHLHDLRKHGLRADLLGPHDEAARGVEAGPDHPVARPFLDRDRLAGDHRLVDARPALDDDAIDRHLFAGAHAKPVSDVHVSELDVLFGSVATDAPRRARREAQQRADRARGLRSRAQLEELAHQRERDDDRGRLEIHLHAAVMRESGWKRLGRDRRDHAVEIGRRDPEPDQGPHIRIPRADRRDAALEEGPAGPKHDGGGEHHLQPVRADVHHSEDEHHERERQRPPEAPPEIDELRVLAFVHRRHLGLECHAALRTSARAGLAHLRMHRACVDRPGRSALLRLLDSCLRRNDVCRGIGRELLHAMVAAEEVRLAAEFEAPRRIVGDRHAADGIDVGHYLLRYPRSDS
jgi:hypothetical protein